MNTHAIRKIVEDATALQNRAADPNNNVWVMASAGTGKTTILVERFIRLVLNGTAPDKILCLTYTKAAATQMKERILKRVGAWVRMDETALKADVESILLTSTNDATLRKARNMMGELLDQIDRLNIMTIHAFCQSLLARFQLEAGLPGGLDVMEDWKASNIFTAILQTILESDDSPYIEELIHLKTETEWHDLLQMIVNDRIKFQGLFADEVDLSARLNDALGLGDNPKEHELITAALSPSLLPALPLLERITEKDSTQTELVRRLARGDAHASDLRPYADIFLLKGKWEPRSLGRIKDDDIRAVYLMEQARLLNLQDQIGRIRTRDMTLCLSYLARQALRSYKHYKDLHGVLDYQDLIERTVSLLSLSDARDWILYKLDGGIDQVLVDEAQDTNPLQWHIIAKLIEEYFTGLGTHEDVNRTLFVVGDTKQSIYSFQGADPETANAYQDIFRTSAIEAGKAWEDVPLGTSFRTSQDILDIVDACAAWGPTVHTAGKDLPGLVECWPFIETEKSAKDDEFWQFPREASVKAQRQIVEQTADHIKALLDRRLAIPSKKGQAAEAHDILILVQKRNHFQIPLIHALRQRNVPVAGIDSFKLTDDVAIQDILSLLNWSLFPDDDLALAEVLKSPLVNWNDTQLGAIAIGRAGTLFQSLAEKAMEVAHWLSMASRHIRQYKPAHSIQTVLEMPCPAGRSGYSAMQERLGPASLEALEQLLSYARSRDDEEQTVFGFIKHLETFAPTIKREMEGENAQGVRIMTLHGAKGLEAPVVYMIDTLQERSFLQRASNLQWLDHDGVLLPLWAPRNEDTAPELKELKETQAEKLQAESYRLLYVGMTRAKDYLVVGGAGKTNKDESDWYSRVRAAMVASNATDMDGVLSYGQWQQESAITSPVTPETAVPDAPSTMPAWQTDEEDAAPVEMDNDGGKARAIGRQWHKLLERAIDRSDEEWAARMADWLDDLPDIEIDKATQRLQALRNHGAYGFLFQPGGAAEVPFITRGELPIRGRIDRLVQTDDAVWIIDYKTRLDPANAVRLEAYRLQLAGYKAALEPIALGKPVKTLLVDVAESRVLEL